MNDKIDLEALEALEQSYSQEWPIRNEFTLAALIEALKEAKALIDELFYGLDKQQRKRAYAFLSRFTEKP